MKEFIDRIERLKSKLSGFEQATVEDRQMLLRLETIIGHQLPNEIKSLLVNFKEQQYSHQMASLMMGYAPFNIDEVLNAYLDPTNSTNLMFCGLQLTENLILAEDNALSIYQDLNTTYEEGNRILDLKDVVPIMNCDGFYLVLLYKSETDTEIAVWAEDFLLSSIAPSLMDYLENLQKGIEKGIYNLNSIDGEVFLEDDYEDEIWDKRLKAVSR